MTTATETIRAPRGSKLNCKGWQQEGALRCLMNNLDPEVAERPADLVVYGGIGKAARNQISRNLQAWRISGWMIFHCFQPFKIKRGPWIGRDGTQDCEIAKQNPSFTPRIYFAETCVIISLSNGSLLYSGKS